MSNSRIFAHQNANSASVLNYFLQIWKCALTVVLSPCSARLICMPLRFKYQSKQELPADHQSLYVERDGAFVLDVDGAVDKARAEELRANSIALSNQLAEQKKRYDGIDPDEARKLAEEKQMRAGEVVRV